LQLLPLPFCGEVFLLSVAQGFRQLRISRVIGQQQDLRIRPSFSRQRRLLRRSLLPPSRPRFQPKDDRRGVARLGLIEQVTGDCRIGSESASNWDPTLKCRNFLKQLTN
jgi:hypothetical protein